MQHLKVKIDFKDVEPFEKLEYDHQLTQKGREEDLKRFVVTYYEQDLDDFKSEDYDTHFKGYQDMIDSAIKNDNLMALEILWQGVYWHDRDHPYFLKDVYVAAEFGTFDMFQHCLYAFMNYTTFEAWKLKLDKLCQLAEKNSDKGVLRFIQHVAPCAKNGKLKQLGKHSEKEIEDGSNYYQSSAQFYRLVELF